MNFDEFNSYRDQALLLHTSQQGEQRISLDAIFSALVVRDATRARGKPGRKPVVSRAPTWFTDAVQRLKGQRVTVTSFLMLSGRVPITDDDSRGVGRWLRDAGYAPRKTGGQLMFQL